MTLKDRFWPKTGKLGDYLTWSFLILTALYFPLRMIWTAMNGGM